MNRAALLLLIVATLVGCSGGTASAPQVPDPGPRTPVPVRQPHTEELPSAGIGTSSHDARPGESVLDPVDWIELRRPPFQHGETEYFLLHLASPCDELTWRTASLEFVKDVKSDQGQTEFFTDSSGDPAPIFRATIPGAGPRLQCFPFGYRDVTIECTITRGLTETVVSATYFPQHAPPRAEGRRHYGVVGMSGQERSWSTGFGGQFTDLQWDFGGGASPNTIQGQPVQTTLGAPGRYTASYTIRNDAGFSGPEQVGYWIQPLYSNYSLPGELEGTPSMVILDDRVRILLTTEEGCRYAEALTATPESAADWRFSDLPLPESHTLYMELGVHAGKLLVVGGLGTSGGDEVVLYYQAAVSSPQSTSDWNVGGIPGSDGLEVLDQVIEADRVGLLTLQSGNLVLLWDDTPTLSQWQFSEVVHAPSHHYLERNQLLLPETGPVVVGLDLLPGEPAGLSYRSATYDAPDEWSAHRIFDASPWGTIFQLHTACTYQGRPLVLASLHRFSSTLLWSTRARPMNAGDWERLETSEEVSVQNSPALKSVHVSGDRIVMSRIHVEALFSDGESAFREGGVLLQGNPSDLAQWTPFLAPRGMEREVIFATVLTDDGVGVLSKNEGVLKFGMLTP